MKSCNIGNYMVTSPHSIEPALDLQTAKKIMRSKKIRHLPVVKNERLLGILSERDLKAALSLPQAGQLNVSDIMTSDVFVASRDESLATVALEMATRKVGSTLIVNNKNQVIGIFTTTDALNLLAELADDETMEVFLEEEDYEAWPSLATTRSTYDAFSVQTEEL